MLRIIPTRVLLMCIAVGGIAFSTAVYVTAVDKKVSLREKSRSVQANCKTKVDVLKTIGKPPGRYTSQSFHIPRDLVNRMLNNKSISSWSEDDCAIYVEFSGDQVFQVWVLDPLDK